MKKNKKEKQKVLFIDANIFISCLFGEKEKTNLSVIKKIEKNIINENILLVLPEIVESEVIWDVDEQFDTLESDLKSVDTNTENKTAPNKKSHQFKKNVLKSLENGFKAAKTNALEELEKNKKEILEAFFNFLKHKNIRKIFLSEKIISLGIKRSLLRIRPHGPHTKDKDKGNFSRDQDCVNFECLLDFLKNNKNKFSKVILCCDDVDYFVNKEDAKLHPDITSDIEKCGCDVIGYKDPLIMLEKEFKTSFTSAQKKEYNETKQKLSSVWFDNLSVATTRPNASIRALSAFDYCSPHTTAYVVGCSSNYITRDSEDCPICGQSIKQYLRAYLEHHKTVEVFATTKNLFECPFCRNELTLYPGYPEYSAGYPR